MAPFTDIAVAFAAALVEGDFTRAHGFLAPELRAAFSPSTLRERFRRMYTGYAESEPTHIHYDDQFFKTDWPNRIPRVARGAVGHLINFAERACWLRMR